MYENFLAYRRYVWGKLTLATTLALVISYIIYSRRVSPNGATMVGLIYGIISFVAILLLMYYGMRKRSYTAKHWSLRAWLSFHVYIGTMTLLLVPLHAGFKFGFDIHTLAYVLLAIVVVSGIIGAALYLLLPRRFETFGEELTYPLGIALMTNYGKLSGKCAPWPLISPRSLPTPAKLRSSMACPRDTLGGGSCGVRVQPRLLWRRKLRHFRIIFNTFQK
jgi:hypothetical protein